MASLTFTLESLPAPARATKVLRLEPRGEWTTTDGAVVGRDDYVQDSYARGAEHALDLPPGPWVLILGTQKFAFDLPTGGGDLATLVAWGIPANTPQATINAAVETFGSAWLTNFTDSTLAAKVTGAGPMKAALDGNYAPESVASEVQEKLDADTLAQGVAKIALPSTRADWWAESRRGIFVHYVFGGGPSASVGSISRAGTKASTLDEMVSAFDLDTFVADVVAFGVDYMIFTAWHYAMHALYPSAVLQATLPGHAASHDLLADIIAALKPHGIKSILYIHPLDGHDLTTEEQSAAGWGDYTAWNDFICSLVAECGARYGTDLDGFWVDMIVDPDFAAKIDAPRFRRALMTGNPARVLIGNRGANDNIEAAGLYKQATDFACYEHLSGDPSDLTTAAGTRNSAAIVIGGDWMSYYPQSSGWTKSYSHRDEFRHLVLCAGVNTEGGGLAYGAGPYIGSGAGSLWENGVESAFLDLESRVAPVRASLHAVIASASWPTVNTITLANLPTPGYVATRDAAKDVEYIHVLNPPATGLSITLPKPKDGARFYDAINIRTGNPVIVTPTAADGLTLTLDAEDTWHADDTVISLRRIHPDADRVWVGAAAFGSGDGATYSSKAISGRYSAWTLSADANQQVEATFSVPRGWQSFRVELYFAQPSSGAGVAELTITEASTAPGEVTNIDGDGEYLGVTMLGTTDTLSSVSPFAPVATRPGAVHHIRISRYATDGGDTGPAIAIMGMMLYRAT